MPFKKNRESDYNLPIKPKRGRPSKIDPVKPIIDDWLIEDLNRPAKQRHTGTRVYERLRNEHSDIFNAGERTVWFYSPVL